MFKNLRRISSTAFNYLLRREKVSSLPLFIQLEPSSVCNLRCAKCVQDKDDWEKGLMDYGLFKKIAGELEGVTSTVGIYGLGESLLHPKLPEMVSYLKKKNLKVLLHTNGTLLDEKKSAALINAGLDIVSFSFDGYEKEVYEKLQKGAVFENTLENIRGFLRQKKKLKSGMKAVIQLLEYGSISKIPERQLRRRRQDFKRLFRNLPVDEFNLNLMHNWGGKIGSTGGSGARYTVCTFPWYHLFIRFNGDVIPCCMDIYGKYKLGNLKEDHLRDIWNGEKIRMLRRKLSSKKYDEVEICRNCDRIWKKSYLSTRGSNVRLIRRFLRLWIKK